MARTISEKMKVWKAAMMSQMLKMAQLVSTPMPSGR